MARKLKTYVTSIGFYDLAIAAPSMKAAPEAWGAKQNLFHQGLAQETNDPGIEAAAIAKPGTVLRRAVGTSRPYQEQAAPPDTLPARAPKPTPTVKKAAAKRRAEPDSKAQKAAIISFEQARATREKARRQQDAERAKEQAATEREDEKRRQAIAKAQAVLDRARERHQEKIEAMEQERQALEDRLAAEQERWRKEEKQLERYVRNIEA